MRPSKQLRGTDRRGGPRGHRLHGRRQRHDTNSGGVKTGGHLILGTLSNIDTLNPFVTFQQNSYSTFEYIYPQLVQYDLKTLEFVPDFARTWETSADGLTWTFHTVPNAKWSDGQPLTANDAAFTFDTILKYGDGPAANLVGRPHAHDQRGGHRRQHARPHVLGARRQRLVEPAADLDPPPAGVGSSTRWATARPSASSRTSRRDQPLVSGGPFELAKYKKDQVAIFQRNPNFYGTKPAIDGFGLQYFSNDDSMVCGPAERPDPGRDQRAGHRRGVPEGGLLPDRLQRPGHHAARLHHQLQPGEDDEPRAPGSEGPHGHGVRDRPRHHREDRVARLRRAGVDDRGSRHRRIGTTRRSRGCRSTSTRRTRCSTRPGTRGVPTGSASRTVTR